MVLVDTTEGGLRAVTFLVGIAQVESKHGLINKLLVDHVVEGRNHLVHGDGVVSKAENAVEATESKGQTRLVGGLGEVLAFNLQVTNLESVLGDKATQAAGSIADLELGAILLVCARRRRVIFAVEEAGNGAARLGWNPEVGATSVKDNLEGLGRGTNLDLREV